MSSQNMKLETSVFKDGSPIPAKYTCDGLDVSPPLTISGVPKGTKALALIMEDPDAPAGTWVHWVIFNIDPTTRMVPEGTSPIGIAGKGSGGDLGYNGPCPPSGTHRYIFTLYALNESLKLPEGSSKDEVMHAMSGFTIAEASLTGTYARGK